MPSSVMLRRVALVRTEVSSKKKDHPYDGAMAVETSTFCAFIKLHQ
jgi:hypothetical protein